MSLDRSCRLCRLPHLDICFSQELDLFEFSEATVNEIQCVKGYSPN